MENLQEQIDQLYLNGIAYRETISHKLPIEYVSHQKLSETIRNDLEIGKINPLYKHLFHSTPLMDQWCENYTTDKSFLKHTQRCIKRYSVKDYVCDGFQKGYQDFISETNFIDKYQYIGFKFLKHLNESSTFLHSLSLYNLASPVLSLLSPLMMLILPFMIIKLQNGSITIDAYIQHLKKVFVQTSLYQLLFNTQSLSLQSRMSALFSLFIYGLQLYNNTISCVSFYRNITKVYQFLIDYKTHIKQSIDLCREVSRDVSAYSSYEGFRKELSRQLEGFYRILDKLEQIRPCETIGAKISQVGLLMNLYYDLFMKEENHASVTYSFFIHDFNRDMLSLRRAVREKIIRKCTFKSETKMKGLYYLPHQKEKVRNDADLKSNLMISGPNASGKTTLLKSVFLNTIMSQQFGFGCYEKASIHCYDVFHSYLNIPDTSGRDSLFQAEARRCKDIVDCIVKFPEKRHLCIFDEIYSGTNPSDAVSCAKLYLEGLNKYKSKVDYMITTHYIELCEHFKGKPLVSNKKMMVREFPEKLEYDYKMTDGISYINGGMFILKQLEYSL